MKDRKIVYQFIISIIVMVVLLFPMHTNAASLIDAKGTIINESNSASDSKKYYISSGSKIDLNYVPSFTYVVNDNAEVTVSKKPLTTKIEVQSSNGTSCNLLELQSNNFSSDNGVFTLTNLELNENNGAIARISCNPPTTNEYIKLASTSYIKVKITTHYVDYANDLNKESDEIKNYYITFGVLNETYLNSLNKNTAIKSFTFNGNSISGLRTVEVSSDKANIVVKTTNLLDKNKITVTYTNDKYKNRDINFGDGTFSVPLEYGNNTINIKENTERGIFVDSLEKVDTLGLSDSALVGTFSYTYSIVANRRDTRSHVNTLDSLTITSANIVFKPNVTNYDITVKNDVSLVQIYSKLSDSKSNYVKGYGNRTVQLDEGLNKILLKIKSEYGEERTYTLNITREASGDNILKELYVNDMPIKLVDGVFKYATSVNSDIIKANINAVPRNNKATVKIENLNDLKEGINEIKILVTAANEKVREYFLSIKKENKPSNNSFLSSLQIDGYDLKFNKNIKKYVLKIKDEEELKISPIAEDAVADILVTGNKMLKDGSIIIVKVTAVDGTSSIYEIDIKKEATKSVTLPFFILGFGIVMAGIIITCAVLYTPEIENETENSKEKQDVTEMEKDDEKN